MPKALPGGPPPGLGPLVFELAEDGERPCRRRRRRPPLSSVSAGKVPSTSGQAGPALQAVPAGVRYDSRLKRYAWDAAGGRLRAVDPADLQGGEHPGRTLLGHAQRALGDARAAFFPAKEDVTPDYWEYCRWRASHRLFSSMASIFATQSLLQAVGVGAAKSLPAAAAINWVLKDGLGRLGRLTVATRFGESFDSDLKRFRYTTSLIYASCLGLEYLTPLFPQHFLPMAAVANVGKSVGLATFIATQPAFHRSFAKGENLAHISAKAQAQQMVMDNVGLAIAVGATHAAARSGHELLRRRLPLLLLPLLAAGDLYSIYRELRSVHLRTLNKERAELLAEGWAARRVVLSPKEVSAQEQLVAPPRIERGCLPLTICSLDRAVRSPGDLQALLDLPSDQKYLLVYSPPHCSANRGQEDRGQDRGQPATPGWRRLQRAWARLRPRRRPRCDAGGVRVALRSDARAEDVVLAVLQAACLRQRLGVGGGSSSGSGAGSGEPACGAGGACVCGGLRWCADASRARREALRQARSALGPFLVELERAGWQPRPFMLSSAEKRAYVALPSLAQ